MRIGLSHVAKGMLVVAAMALMTGTCWAIYYALGPSSDEWGLKYNVKVSEADSDNLDLVFTLIDEGRLKPIYKIELIAFSKQTDSQGGRSYDVLVPLKFKVEDGKRVAQVQLKKEFADRGHFRVLTQMVDGKRQPSGGAYYNIHVSKYWNEDGPVAPSPLASPPASKVKR